MFLVLMFALTAAAVVLLVGAIRVGRRFRRTPLVVPAFVVGLASGVAALSFACILVFYAIDILW